MIYWLIGIALAGAIALSAYRTWQAFRALDEVINEVEEDE